MSNSFLNKDYLSFMTSIFKSDEEKEKERLAKIYTNPVTGEVEQYASGLMGMRPEVINQIKTSAQQNMQGMLFGAGPQFTALENVPMQGTVPTPTDEELLTNALKERITETYDLSKGTFKSAEIAKEIQEASKLSPMTMLTLMSAFGGASDRPSAPTITSQPTATPGLMFRDEDLYKRYRGLL
jgi:hypothetical protein